MGSLDNLIELTLWNNQLTGEIPSELGDLASLTNLALHGNQFECVPSSLMSSSLNDDLKEQLAQLGLSPC